MSFVANDVAAGLLDGLAVSKQLNSSLENQGKISEAAWQQFESSVQDSFSAVDKTLEASNKINEAVKKTSFLKGNITRITIHA